MIASEPHFPPAIADFLKNLQQSELVAADVYQQLLTKLLPQKDKLKDQLGLAAALVRSGHLSTWQAKQLLRGRFRNFIVKDKHIILEHLATGGMGSVYLCEHMRLKQLVALKMIEVNQVPQATVQRFEREARVVFSLNHPNIVRAFDFDQDGKYLYIVMEYVDGINLYDLVVKSGPLSLAQAASHISQAAQGLQYSAEAGLVHRDIKPGNLLLHRSGLVKVLDLGLARTQNQSDALTQHHDPNAVLGTIDFMAPEQALGTQAVDIRADLYSLGASFYFLLTGQLPFGEGNMAQKLLSHQISEPTPIETYRNDLPKRVCQIIHSMMSKQPSQRPRQPIEVVEALKSWCGPLTLPPESLMPVYSPRVRRLLDPQSTGLQTTLTDVALITQSRYLTTQPHSVSALSRVPGPHSTASGGVRSVGNALSINTQKFKSQISKGGQLITKTLHRRVSRVRAYTAIALVLALTTILVLYFTFSTSKPVEVNRPAAIRLPLQVSKYRLNSNSTQQAFSSIADALRAARPGDQITIVDDVWQEQVNETALNLQQVTLTSGGDKPIRWKAPDQAISTEPLLSLRDARGFTIRNIIFDGGNHPTLIRLEGDCSGLECSHLKLLGATKQCLQLWGTKSTLSDNSLIKINHTLFSTDRDNQVAAIRLEGQGTNNDCGSLFITQCIAHGKFSEVIAVDTNVQRLDFTFNRINGAEAFIRFASGKQLTTTGLKISNNHFHTVDSIFSFSNDPASSDRIILRNNLFVDVQRLLQKNQNEEVVAGELPWLRSDGNYADEKSWKDPRNWGRAITLILVPRLKNTDPENPEYLSYPANSVMAKIKTADGNIGIPPN